MGRRNVIISILSNVASLKVPLIWLCLERQRIPCPVGIKGIVECIKMLGIIGDNAGQIGWENSYNAAFAAASICMRNSQLSQDHCRIWSGLPSCPTIFGSLLLKSCPHFTQERFLGVKMYNFAQISCDFKNLNFWGQNHQKLSNFKTFYKSNEKS